TFTATAGKTITTSGAPFAHLAFNGSGGTWTMQDRLTAGGNLTVTLGTLDTKSGSNFYLTVTSDVAINGGTLNLNDSTMTATGSWSRTAGTFNGGTSTVTFTAVTAKTITPGGQSFAHMTFNGSASTWTLGGALAAAGNL